MDYGLYVDYEWCSGCHACELACKQEHDLKNGRVGHPGCGADVPRQGEGRDRVCPIPRSTATSASAAFRRGRTGLRSSLHDQVHGIRPLEEMAKLAAKKRRRWCGEDSRFMPSTIADGQRVRGVKGRGVK